MSCMSHSKVKLEELDSSRVTQSKSSGEFHMYTKLGSVNSFTQKLPIESE
jgi:hypothetical protein